jgi:hypothetical protein
MAIPSRQIGWGTESNLLWQILKQLSRLTSTLFSLKEAATPKYKVYTALLTQSGENAPVVTVLENTIGNISFNYGTAGVYVITCDNLFIENKTWYTPVIISNIANITNGEIVWRNVNEIRIITNLDGALADGVLSNTPIEIRIYN